MTASLLKRSQQRTAFAFGVLFVSVLVILAIAFPTPSQFQYVVFRIILALAAAGVAAMIPGFVEIQVPGWIRAGGAIAVFVIVFFYNPATLVASPTIEALPKGSATSPPGPSSSSNDRNSERSRFLQLLTLIKHGDLSAISSQFPDRDAVLNLRDEIGRTPLHHAAAEGSIPITTILLDRGADPNAQDDHRASPLLAAIDKRQLAVAQLLLSRGAVVPDWLKTMSTANSDSDELIKLSRRLIGLSKLHASDILDDSRALYLLHSALHDGNVRWATDLLQEGIDPNAVSRQEESGLACYWRYVFSRTNIGTESQWALGRRLITDFHGNPNGYLADGSTLLTFMIDALGVEARHGSAESWDMFDFILEHGADVNLADKNGAAPLNHATYCANSIATRLLIKNGADVHGKSKAGNTPLHNIARARYDSAFPSAINSTTYVEIIDYLLDAGAKINDVDADGRTALHLCAANAEAPREVTEYLIRKGADANKRDRFGRTAAEHARDLRK